jgi:hypothetical protein
LCPFFKFDLIWKINKYAIQEIIDKVEDHALYACKALYVPELKKFSKEFISSELIPVVIALIAIRYFDSEEISEITALL